MSIKELAGIKIEKGRFSFESNFVFSTIYPIIFMFIIIFSLMKSSILGATLLVFSIKAQPQFDISKAIQESVKFDNRPSPSKQKN